jgi:hypothetical protein
VKTLFQRPDQVEAPLYVVTTVFNAARWRTRWKLYEDFARHVAAAPAAILYTVEIAFGAREFVVTERDNPRHLQLRVDHEIWYKENAINLGVARLPSDWSYVGWIDGDVTFLRADWANETLHKLQHYAFVQLWSQYQDVSLDYEVIGTASSFADMYLRGGPKSFRTKAKSYPYPYGTRRGYPGAPGLAWACRREAWEAVGGLLDVCILGAGDWYMAHALVGEVERLIRPEYKESYKEALREWQARALRFVNAHPWGRLGVVPGMALHHWHGPKAKRHYGTRDEILIRNGYDPLLDLKRDWQGLYQLTGRSVKLREEIRRYFLQRREDDSG